MKIKKKVRLLKIWNNLEEAFKKATGEVFKEQEKKILKQAENILKSSDKNFNKLKIDLSDFQNILLNYLLECRRAGRAEGFSDVYEIRSKTKTRQKRKKLERTLFQNIVDLFTGEIKSEFENNFDKEEYSLFKELSSAFEVVPKSAIKKYKEYTLYLTNVYEQELLNDTKQEIISGLENGFSLEEIMAPIQLIFQNFSKHRVENIARTELSKAYNGGSLEAYTSEYADGFVIALKFSSILDSRVTDICERRNGLYISAKNPDLMKQRPPLHFRCRSVFLPISKFDIEDNPEITNLIDKGWENVPPPFKGFGG